jgi:hypothetical protein
MWLQKLSDYLLKHRWQAMVLTFLITYIPVLGMGSIVIAALATLCLGVVDGALFTLAASLPYLLIFLLGSPASIPSIMLVTVILTIAGNVLTWAFAVLLRRGWKWSALLQMAALFGVLVVSVLHLAFPDVADWWGSQLTAYYNQALKGMMTGNLNPLNVGSVAGSSLSTSSLSAGSLAANSLDTVSDNPVDLINTLKSFMTGLLMAYVLFASIVQTMLARWWQVSIVNHSRMGKELHYVHLTRLAGSLFILSLVFYYLENSVILDILPILCLLFGAAGLSLTHYICGVMEPAKGRFWLSTLYAALMFSLVVMAMLPLFTAVNIILPALPVKLAVLIFITSIFAFVSLGLFDIWFDLRKRVHKVKR